MKRLFCFMVFVAIVWMSPALQAQADCDAAKLKEDMQAELDALEENPIGVLESIINLALGGLHDCSDESYTYEGFEGAQPVLGPLTVSEGLHIITMTTEGGARIDGVALEGCGKDLDGVIHNISAGQGIRGAANLVEVESDCVFYLELSKITAPWTLTITRAR